RVVGFDGSTVTVPYVARKDQSEGWIPENVEHGIVRSPGSGEPPRRLTLTAEQLQELQSSVLAAKEVGRQHVAIPGTDVEVPLLEAEHCLHAFEAADVQPPQRRRRPAEAKDPKPLGRAPTLK